MRVAVRPYLLLRGIVTASVLHCALGVSVGQAQANPVAPPPVLQRERIIGTVRTDSGVAVRGAIVSVTRAPDRMVRQDTTDSGGAFAISWPEGTGDYLLHAAAPGLGTFRKRLLRTTSSDSLYVVEVVVRSPVAVLSRVTVRAARQRPARTADAYTTPVGGGTSVPEGLAGAVAPEERGSLSALASTVPGVVMTPGGASVLGAAPEQNNATLDGLAFTSTDVPREARVTAGVATTPYDPSRGGFSGLQIALNIAAPTLYTRRTASVVLDAPVLQVSDRAFAEVGQKYGNVLVSGGADGPLGRRDQLTYSVAGQFSWRHTSAVSLFAASPLVLRAAGLDVDTVAALRGTLGTLGVPVGSTRAEPRISRQASLLGRIGTPTADVATNQPSRRTAALTIFAKLDDTDATGVGPMAASTLGSGVRSGTLGVQGLLSAYRGANGEGLSELRSGATVSRTESTPRSYLPTASVLLRAPNAQGLTSVTPVNVAGGGREVSATRWTWETLSETQWYTAGVHRLKLTAQSRLDGVREQQGGNLLGSYTYQSLDALRANAPSAFSRTLIAPVREATVWNAVLAIGDFWKAHDALELVYGARLEGNRYMQQPTRNAELQRALGVRTDAVPNRVHASPRVGFTWRYRAGPAEGGGYSSSPVGQFPNASRGYLRGGIGEFRSLASPSLITAPLVTTGLRDGAESFDCVGDAVPIPDWRLLAQGIASLPTSCLDGPSFHADTAPFVRVIDPKYDVARSWRANLAWSGKWRALFLTVDAAASLNLNQPSLVDANLRVAPVTMLASEGGRALYVPTGSIVSNSGQVVPVDARIAPSFGEVGSLQSDLRSHGRRVTMVVQPDLAWTSRVALSYSFGSIRQQYRGSDGGAFGDVRAREWARGEYDVRHQFQLSAGRAVRRLKGTVLTVFVQARSGLPFTPLVVGDLNGDGRANDRAFVHHPDVAQAAGDVHFAEDMRHLLASAPERAGECLARSLGKPATRQGCDGPWSLTSNARIELPWSFWSMGSGTQRRARIAVNLANPLGGVDRLIHGRDGVRGWGAPAWPEPVLYTRTGFDEQLGRFRYAVNPRFGNTEPSRSLTRAPFRLTVEVSIDLGRPLPEQQLARFLEPGRRRPGVPLDSAALHRRYLRNLPNIYQSVLLLADSLLLSRSQIEALQQAERVYLGKVNLLWAGLAREFAHLPGDFDPSAALRRQEAVTDAGWDLNRDEARRIRDMLSPTQFALTSPTVQYLASEDGRIRMRYFY
jgi:hypothetical protein